MKLIIGNILRVVLTGAVVAVSVQHSSAQQNRAAEYQKRAENMYMNVWKRYRVPARVGLFSENYPSGKTYLFSG
jgi:hypothetical protein